MSDSEDIFEEDYTRSPSSRESDRQEIQRLTEDFLISGGVIEDVPMGEVGRDYNTHWNAGRKVV